MPHFGCLGTNVCIIRVVLNCSRMHRLPAGTHFPFGDGYLWSCRWPAEKLSPSVLGDHDQPSFPTCSFLQKRVATCLLPICLIASNLRHVPGCVTQKREHTQESKEQARERERGQQRWQEWNNLMVTAIVKVKMAMERERDLSLANAGKYYSIMIWQQGQHWGQCWWCPWWQHIKKKVDKEESGWLWRQRGRRERRQKTSK